MFHITEPRQNLPEIPEFAHQYHKWWYTFGPWRDDTKWGGITTHKLPTDMWLYQEILFDLRPSLVVEVGTRFGGSTSFFSDVMMRVHGRDDTNWRVLTVDIDTSIRPEARNSLGVEVLTAPSASLRV